MNIFVIVLGMLMVVLSFAIVSTYYSRANVSYGRNRIQLSSVPFFKPTYRYIQISSGPVAIGSYFTSHPIFLMMHASSTIALIALLIPILALLIFCSAVKCLGDQYSPCYDLHAPEKLITHGLYGYIRHPLYSANILLLFGFCVSTGSLLLLFNTLLLAGFYTASARREERFLAHQFSEYRAYKESTGRFIPRLRPWRWHLSRLR